MLFFCWILNSLFDGLAFFELPGHERRSSRDKSRCLRVEEFDFEGPGVGKRVKNLKKNCFFVEILKQMSTC